MTLPATTRRAGPFNGNGSATSFPFTFKVFAGTDLKVVVTSAAGAETTLTGSQYTVVLNSGGEGGTVVYPVSGAPLATGAKLSIISNVPYDQPAALPAGGSFSPRVIEAAFDRATMQIQQLLATIGRSVTLSDAAADNVSALFPAPGAGQLIGWNAAGTALRLYDTTLGGGSGSTLVQTQRIIATANQTVFTLTAMTYTPNTATLMVVVNGLALDPIEYTETSSTVVTMLTPLMAGDEVRFRAFTLVDTIGLEISQVQYLYPAAGAASRPVNERLDRDLRLDDFAGVDRTGAADTAAAMNAAIAAASASLGARRIFVSSGTYRFDSAITVPAGVSIVAAGRQQTIFKFYGTAGFNITGDHVHLSDFEAISVASDGAADPKASVGIAMQGTVDTKRNFVTLERLYMRGWLRGVDLRFTWNSSLHEVYTVNCATCVRLFGQSVNNQISDSRLISNGGAGSIGLNCVPDGISKGEGLMVSNTLIAQAENNVVATEFLALQFANCVIDLADSAAVVLNDCQAFALAGSWVYGSQFGVVSNGSAAPLEMGNRITGCWINAVATGYPVNIGANNVGWSITGNFLKGAATLVSAAASASGVSIIGNHGSSPSAAAYALASADTVCRDNTGNVTGTPLRGSVTWNPGVLDTGDQATSPDITVPGAVSGDCVVIGAPYDLQGGIMCGYVKSAGIVNVSLYWPGADGYDLPSGTWNVRILR
jgi:hypothetical protein